MRQLFCVGVFFLLSCSTSAKVSGQKGFVLSFDSVRIAYETYGGGDVALVFVHGWSCDRSYWNKQVPAFSDKYRVVTIDFGGHGESGLGRKEWTVESYGKDVAAVVEKLELNKVILIGHSMGGDVVAEAAFRLRERVSGMVFVDQYKSIGSGMTVKRVDGFIANLQADFVPRTSAFVRSFFVPASDKALVDWVAADMSSAPKEVALSTARYALLYGKEIGTSLRRLKLPVVAINPDNAPTDLPSMKQHGVEVLIMPGVGHFLMMEDAPRFNALLTTAIKKIQK